MRYYFENYRGRNYITLKRAETFKFRYTDTYEEVLNYTLEELKTELEKCKHSIVEQILELFKTKRSNLYKSISPLWDFKTNFKFFRNELPLKNLERDFINYVFLDLIQDRRIIESENTKIGKIYRTATK